MSRIVNWINLLGWAIALLSMLERIYTVYNQKPDWKIDDFNPPINRIDISYQVLIVQAVQTFQILDIILILIGKSKGSLLGSIAQITGRLVVAWGFLESGTYQKSFFLMAIMWAIADSNRYLYYLYKNSFTGGMRYNFFIILYPVGVTGEMLVINDYIFRHIEDLTIDHIRFIRFVQFCIILGTILLYFYMLSMRRKFYRDLSL